MTKPIAYAVRPWTHRCPTGTGHVDGPIRWERRIGKQWIGDQTCRNCDATQRVIEYAAHARNR